MFAKALELVSESSWLVKEKSMALIISWETTN